MKISLILAAIILVVGVFALQQRSTHLVALHEQQAQVAAELKTHNLTMSSDLAEARAAARREREDPAADTDAMAERMVRLFNASNDPDFDTNDKDAEKEGMELIGEISMLRTDELLALLAALEAHPALDEQAQSQAKFFIIMMMGTQNPEGALAVIDATVADDGLDEMMAYAISIPLANLAKTHPDAALAWIAEFAEKQKDVLTPGQLASMLQQTASIDLASTLAVADELGIEDDERWPLYNAAATAAVTPEQRLSLFQQVRSAEKPAGMAALFRQVGQDDIATASAWLEQAKLTDDEWKIFANQTSGSNLNEGNAEWIEWIHTHEQIADHHRQDFVQVRVRTWTYADYQAAGEWVNGLESGPLKTQAAATYAETVLPYDREAASIWAATLPDGEAKTALLKKIAAESD